MLSQIEIKNYALIDSINITLDPGLNIVTGETGAGKSILLGALGLVMGKRADTKVLFNPDEKCIVEVTYAVKKLGLKPLFKSLDLDYDDELNIRREISTSGKSRAFINDTPVTLDVLQTVNEQLIDVHQQFDNLDIQRTDRQLEIIDIIADNHSTLAAYETAFAQYKEIKQKVTELHARKSADNKEIEFQLFQLKELEEARLQEINLEEAENRLDRLENAELVKTNLSEVAFGLEESDQSLTSSLLTVIQYVRQIAHLSPDFQALQERLEQVFEELRDAAKEAGMLAENTELDAEAAALLQEHLNKIYRLQKKHGTNNLEDLIKLSEALKLKVGEFESLDEVIAHNEAMLVKARQELEMYAATLSEKRKTAAESLTSDVVSILRMLAMPNARLETRFEQTIEPTSTGMDKVEWLFSANKGTDVMPLKDVASGGEISRLSLAIKSIVARKSALPTMVFDEIDSGVSGEVASKMAAIIRQISTGHQTIVITHAPQIAAAADRHYFVYKYDSSHRTHSDIKALNPDERIAEIATMMSGHPPPTASIEAAKSLIERSRQSE